MKLTSERATDIYISLMLSLFILICGPYTSIVYVKYAAFLALSGLYIAIMVICSLKTGQKLFKFDGLTLCVAIYFLLTLVSALISDYFPMTIIGASRFEGALTVFIYCAVFLLVRQNGKIGQRHIFIFALSMIALCLIAVLQFLGLNPLWLYPKGLNYYDAYTYYSGQYLGTIGNADFSSAVMTLAIPIFAIGAVKSKGRMCYVSAAAAILSSAVLLYSGTSSGIVGIAVGAVLAVILKAKRPVKPTLFIFAFSIVAFVTIAYILNLFSFKSWLVSLLPDSLGSSRFGIWRQVIGKMGEHLILGTGPDTMTYWNLEGFSRFIPEIRRLVHVGIDATHNEYLHIAAMTGIPALIAYLGIIIIVLKKRKNFLYSAVLCYAVQSFFNIGMCLSSGIFWVILALSCSEKDKEDSI